jgi:hypothetical protein
MRFHPAGLIVLGLFLLLVLIAGAGPSVAVVRGAGIVFLAVVLGEIVVNMIRHRDLRIRSRIAGLLGSQATFASRPRKQ